MKSTNIEMRVIGTLNQLFLECCYTQIKFSKIKVVTGKTLFFAIVPIETAP